MSIRDGATFALITLLILVQIPAFTAQQAIKTANAATDWPMFSHDLSATRYSPLKQINAANAGKLQLAWRMPYRADRNGEPVGGLGACRKRRLSS